MLKKRNFPGFIFIFLQTSKEIFGFSGAYGHVTGQVMAELEDVRHITEAVRPLVC